MKMLAYIKPLAGMFVILCLVAGSVGCTKIKSESSSAEYSAFSAEDNCGITISANNISNTGLTLLFENTQLPAGSISLGRSFSIQVFKEGEWFDLEPITEAIFLTDAFVPSDTCWSMDIDWEWLYGELPQGKYRLSKSLEIEAGFIGASESKEMQETLNVWVEFEIT